MNIFRKKIFHSQNMKNIIYKRNSKILLEINDLVNKRYIRKNRKKSQENIEGKKPEVENNRETMSKLELLSTELTSKL